MGLDIQNSPLDFTSMVSNGANTFLGTLLGFGSQNRQYKLNSKLQRQAADLQFQTWANMTENTRNWNEYDEKLSKMAEAGLNPLYSEGSAPQAAISAAAPSAAVDGFNPPSFDLGASIINALRGRELTYKEREVSALEKQASAYEKKSDAEAETILQVLPYTVNEACERAENMKLSNEEKRKLIENIDAELEIKRDEADAAMSQALSRAMEVAIAESANEWNEDVQRQLANAATSNAQTNFFNFQLASEQLGFELEKYSNTAIQQYHEYLSRLKKNTFETINEIRESMSRDMGPFHIRFSLDELCKTSAAAKAVNDYIKMDDAKSEAKMECRKLLNNLYDMQSRIKAIGLPKNAKKPKFKIENGFNPQP